MTSTGSLTPETPQTKEKSELIKLFREDWENNTELQGIYLQVSKKIGTAAERRNLINYSTLTEEQKALLFSINGGINYTNIVPSNPTVLALVTILRDRLKKIIPDQQ